MVKCVHYAGRLDLGNDFYSDTHFEVSQNMFIVHIYQQCVGTFVDAIKYTKWPH